MGLSITPTPDPTPTPAPNTTTDAREPVPEKSGTIIKVTGRVVDFFQKGAIVQFPTAGGGAIGVATTILGSKIGDRVTIGATVVAADRDTLDVIFNTDGADNQPARLNRFTNPIAKV